MTENGRKFLEFVSGDKALLEKVQNVSIDEVLAVAKECGFELSAEDLTVNTEKHKELDADELGAVSGGGTCVCVVGGGGTATREGQDVCACVGVGMGFVDTYGECSTYMRCACGVGGGGGDFDMREGQLQREKLLS